MWSLAPAIRFTRAVDPAQVDRLALDLQLAVEQLVVAEQVLDDPQVEGARDVLRVLVPVLEAAVAGEEAGVAEAGEQLQVLGQLGLRLERDEAGRACTRP